MPWWGWVIAGVALLGIEMFLIDAQFYLVFLGIAAAIVGLLGLAGVAMPEWLEWLLFAALALLAMFAFRRRLYELLRKSGGFVQERVTPGDRVLVPTRLEPGQTTRLEYRGTHWTARNIDAQAIEAGSEALVSKIDELTLYLKAAGAR